MTGSRRNSPRASFFLYFLIAPDMGHKIAWVKITSHRTLCLFCVPLLWPGSSVSQNTAALTYAHVAQEDQKIFQSGLSKCHVCHLQPQWPKRSLQSSQPRDDVSSCLPTLHSHLCMSCGENWPQPIPSQIVHPQNRTCPQLMWGEAPRVPWLTTHTHVTPFLWLFSYLLPLTLCSLMAWTPTDIPRHP